jgi:hypothetical protein
VGLVEQAIRDNADAASYADVALLPRVSLAAFAQYRLKPTFRHRARRKGLGLHFCVRSVLTVFAGASDPTAATTSALVIGFGAAFRMRAIWSDIPRSMFL